MTYPVLGEVYYWQTPEVFYKCRHITTYILDTNVNISCSYYYILVPLSAHSAQIMLQLKVKSSHRHYISWTTSDKNTAKYLASGQRKFLLR